MSQDADIIKEVESRTIRIVLAEGTQINGQVNIRRTSGQHDRLSDLVVSDDEEFLVVYKATLYKDDLTTPVKHPTIFVNKRHILYATPDEMQR